MANWNSVSKEQFKAICDAYLAGEKTEVIALLHGLSKTAPRKIAKRAGLPPRPRYYRKPRT
jgi:hypothetical protein